MTTQAIETRETRETYVDPRTGYEDRFLKVATRFRADYYGKGPQDYLRVRYYQNGTVTNVRESGFDSEWARTVWAAMPAGS